MMTKDRKFHVTQCLLGLFLGGTVWCWSQDDPAPIPIAELDREEPVDFVKEIYPLLKQNCIACHNSSNAKAQLNLEDPKAILKGGGSGEVVIPGKPEESYLLQVAAWQEDPIMPPEGNKSNAVPFTSEELGLIKLWIAQGAKGEAVIATTTPTEWMLAKRQDYPVYHMDLGPEDRFVAASRGQRVHLYDIGEGTSLGQLVDPQLASDEVFREQPPAHKDFVQSIAFSPEGWIATGGFRNAKLWRPVRPEAVEVGQLPETISALAASHDGAWAAAGDAGGNVRIWRSSGAKEEGVVRLDKAHGGKVSGLAFAPEGSWMVSCGEDGKLRVADAATGEEKAIHEAEGSWSHVWMGEGSQVWAVSAAGAVVRWEIAAGAESSVTTIHEHGKPVVALAGTAAGSGRLFVAGEDGKIVVIDLKAGQVQQTLDHGAPLVDLAFSEDGGHLVSLAATSAKLWQAGEGKLLRELPVAPDLEAEKQRLERKRASTQALVENRKKKLGEREKAWKDEVEKAKKAASDQLAAKEARDAADRALHQARLDEAETARKKTSLEAGVAALKQDVESRAAAEASVRETLEKERPVLETQVKTLLGALNAAETEHGKAVQEVAAIREQSEKQVKVRERSQTALTALRQIAQLQGKAGDVAELILQTENLLADTQQTLSEIDGRLFRAAERERAGAEAIVGRKQAHDEAQRTLGEMTSEAAAAKERLQASQAALTTEEASLKELTESHKKLAEEAKKADDALAQAEKAYAQAIENEALSIRLSQRASEAHTKAQTAVVIAEALLKKDQEALEAKGAAEVGALKAVAFGDSGGTTIMARESDLLRSSVDPLGWVDALEEGAHFLAALPNGHCLVAGDSNRIRRVEFGRRWEWARTVGAIEAPKTLIDRVTALAFSPSGTLLATGSGAPSRSGELKVWRVADGSLVMEMEDAHSDTIVGLEFSPDGKYLATASTDRFAKVFDLRDGSLVTAFEGHTGHVLDVSWRGDGLALATAGADNVVKLWDFEEQRQIKTIDGYNQEITSVSFADLGETLVTSSGDKSVRLGGDRLDGKEFVYASELSQDGQWLIAAAQDSVVRVWQTKDKKLVQEFAPPQP